MFRLRKASCVGPSVARPGKAIVSGVTPAEPAPAGGPDRGVGQRAQRGRPVGAGGDRQRGPPGLGHPVLDVDGQLQRAGPVGHRERQLVAGRRRRGARLELVEPADQDVAAGPVGGLGGAGLGPVARRRSGAPRSARTRRWPPPRRPARPPAARSLDHFSASAWVARQAAIEPTSAARSAGRLSGRRGRGRCAACSALRRSASDSRAPVGALGAAAPPTAASCRSPGPVPPRAPGGPRRAGSAGRPGRAARRAARSYAAASASASSSRAAAGPAPAAGSGSPSKSPQPASAVAPSAAPAAAAQHRVAGCARRARRSVRTGASQHHRSTGWRGPLTCAWCGFGAAATGPERPARYALRSRRGNSARRHAGVSDDR